MPSKRSSETVLSIPIRIKVGFDSEALALEGSHIVGFRRMLLVLIAAQVHLPSQLLHPNVRLPPARHTTHTSCNVWDEYMGSAIPKMTTAIPFYCTCHVLLECTGEAASNQV